MKTMTNNAKAISTFCSHLCVGKDVRPLEPSEWSALAAKMLEIGVAPENLLSFSSQDFIEILGETPESAQRMTRLLERSASLAFEIADYEAKGIHIITRADDEYPKQLKEKLQDSSQLPEAEKKKLLEKPITSKGCRICRFTQGFSGGCKICRRYRIKNSRQSICSSFRWS